MGGAVASQVFGKVTTLRPTVDLPRAEAAVAELLRACGVDPTLEWIRDTPRRAARAYADLLSPKAFKLTTFDNDERYDELVLATAIPFHSLCADHLLPFHGTAHVGYLPNGRLAGLSKLARVVDHFARGLQVQERLTAQIATALQESLTPRGVGVVLQAEHLCMSMRGERTSGSCTITSAMRGQLEDDKRSRQEFFALAGISP